MMSISGAIVAPLKSAPIPKGNSGLVMFDPINVPMESALWPCIIDCRERTSSGRDEPTPIKKTAIKYSLILSFIAIVAALSTKKCALVPRIINPNRVPKL